MRILNVIAAAVALWGCSTTASTPEPVTPVFVIPDPVPVPCKPQSCEGMGIALRAQIEREEKAKNRECTVGCDRDCQEICLGDHLMCLVGCLNVVNRCMRKCTVVDPDTDEIAVIPDVWRVIP